MIKNIRKKLQSISTYKAWFFPIILVLLLLIAGILKISGSSIGEYYKFFYGDIKDNHLLFGTPQAIRSDEWLTVTPTTASQAANDYQVDNPDIGTGEDTSVILDVPYKDWLVLLRPWNIWFTMFHLETAFALKWWTMLVMLGVATYALILQMLPRRYLFASLGALFMMLNPLVHWWYRDLSIATLAFGMAVLVVARCLYQENPLFKRSLLTILLGFFLAVFAFIQYPPFQIMVAFAIASFFIGFLLRQGAFQKEQLKATGKFALWLLGALLFCGLLLGIFYAQHKEAITAIQDTAFPGHRSFESGQGSLGTFMHILFSPYAAELQHHSAAATTYYGNQSEASQFLQYSPLLFVPAIFAIVRTYNKTKKWAWDLISLLIGISIIYAYIFVPNVSYIFKPLLFTAIPINRFAMGIGLLDFLMLILLVRYFSQDPTTKRTAALLAAPVLIAVVVANVYIRNVAPGLAVGPFLAAAVSIWMAASLALILIDKKIVAISMLAGISLISVFRINPLYQGLSPLIQTPLAKAIQNISSHNPQAVWLATTDILRTYPQANGAKSLTGNYSYPQKEIWRQFDSKANEDYVYDRSASVIGKIGEDNSLKLLAANYIQVTIDPCSAMVQKLQIKYVLTTELQSSSCLVQAQKISFPAANVFIYEIKASTGRS